ncbi:hypothetical protein BV898_01125 [Hypsibius exemplaris]|uniref:Uncharacterized protein n=1 Tax=Hypsibius exemplaris TaxID=2072580 RepID=A0A1W0XCB0_HYPEX|nr:hypothetical protein BV898_01125 [Hypsibius exemplaris]
MNSQFDSKFPDKVQSFAPYERLQDDRTSLPARTTTFQDGSGISIVEFLERNQVTGYTPTAATSAPKSEASSDEAPLPTGSNPVEPTVWNISTAELRKNNGVGGRVKKYWTNSSTLDRVIFTVVLLFLTVVSIGGTLVAKYLANKAQLQNGHSPIRIPFLFPG